MIDISEERIKELKILVTLAVLATGLAGCLDTGKQEGDNNMSAAYETVKNTPGETYEHRTRVAVHMARNAFERDYAIFKAAADAYNEAVRGDDWALEVKTGKIFEEVRIVCQKTGERLRVTEEAYKRLMGHRAE